MDREANLPVPPASTNNQPRMIEADSGLSRPLPSTSSSSSPPDFVRHVQAALKRHRPLGIMQSHSLRPRRILVPQREPSKSSSSNVGLVLQTEKPKDVASSKQVHPEDELIEQRESVVAVVEEAPEDSSLTPPSITGTITQDDNLNLLGLHRDGNKADVNCKNNDAISSLSGASPHLPGLDGTKKVQFSLGSNAVSQRADERMATRMDNLSSHLSALALTEMECNVRNRVDISTVNDHDPKQQELQHSEMVDMALSSDGGISSLLAKRSALMQDQQHQFMTFLGKDIGNPMTQSSVLGSTCATTTSVHSTSVPMLNSMTYNSCCHPDSGYHMDVDHLEEFNVNPRSITQRDPVRPSCPTNQCTSGMVADPYAIPTQPSISATETPSGVNDHSLPKGQHDHVLMEGEKLRDGIADHGQCNFKIDDKSAKGEAFSGVVPNVQFQAPSTRSSSSNVKLEPSKSEKSEKAGFGKGASVPRKRNHDPDLFFKVNGRLYQKLGKIGSGGSSEVYKVISANCMIYALKKIKLKGRDYATAYGFCQEIEYLNKLKGKNNIIQLIDYEVTDKTLLEEVMNGSMNIKDGRIKVDGFLYMVLEYGEIDLAHMLSQKWKEMESSSWNMDENWLRFYWQQILQAVNTIHEERIVHSDLKPANFLLVKGSLKLIDFGIAKAIMSDTTNIQRDSQVGTLSYMSPEAFLCNENDANGNTIKCGRPSDIWSLGCILYQMVYGRTPFAEYKTFWAKFKVITDRTHEITYGPVSNPWLLDLMKNCLAWERKDRWRIPQLLQHPFLVPPIQSQLSLPQDQSCRLLQLMAEAYVNDHEASRLCSQLQQLLTDPVPLITSHLSTRDQHCKLLSQMFRLCYQLQQHLTNLGKEGQDSSM